MLGISEMSAALRGMMELEVRRGLLAKAILEEFMGVKRPPKSAMSYKQKEKRRHTETKISTPMLHRCFQRQLKVLLSRAK